MDYSLLERILLPRYAFLLSLILTDGLASDSKGLDIDTNALGWIDID